MTKDEEAQKIIALVKAVMFDVVLLALKLKSEDGTAHIVDVERFVRNSALIMYLQKEAELARENR